MRKAGKRRQEQRRQWFDRRDDLFMEQLGVFHEQPGVFHEQPPVFMEHPRLFMEHPRNYNPCRSQKPSPVLIFDFSESKILSRIFPEKSEKVGNFSRKYAAKIQFFI